MATFPKAQLLRVVGLLMTIASPALGFGETELGAIVGHNPDLSRYGDPGGVWMGRDFSFSIDGTGNISETEHLIARVVRPEWGAEHFSPYQIHYWAERQAVRVTRARIWKSRTEFVDLSPEQVQYGPSPLADGASVYEAMRALELNFPELAEGDVVEISLEREDRVLPGEYNLRWFTHLYGDNIPTLEERLSITAPSALNPAIEQIGKIVRGYRKRRSGFVERFWTTGHLQAFPQEIEHTFHSRRTVHESVPDSSAQIVFATSDWNYMSEYFGLAWNRDVNDIAPEMRTRIATITKGLSASDRARAIESCIQDEIRTLPLTHRHHGLRPYSPKLVWAEGSASTVDKTMLLVAALRLAGLNGYPVLIRTRDEAWLPEMACPDQLDRFLVRVRAGEGEVLWLDPVESETSFPATVGWVISMSEVDAEQGLIDVPAR